MAWLDGLFAGGSVPTLEKALSFSAARHRVILENIANAETPGYRRKDLDPRAFADSLRKAESAGESAEGAGGSRRWPLARAQIGESGSDLPRAGILRHDGNDVDIEMELALLSKNGTFHNQMAALLRKQFDQVRMAINEKSS